MKRYIISRESGFMAVSTMAGTGKIWFGILVFLEAHGRNFRGTLAQNIVNIVYYFYVNFLHLRLTQKALQLPFLFFSIFPSCHWFCVYFIIRYAGRCDQDQTAATARTGKCFRQNYCNCEISNVRIWYTMCFRENSNYGFKRFGHVVFQDHVVN